MVDLDGDHVGGGRPSTEKALHLACYRTYPELGGVVHSHPLHATMFAVAREPIPAVIEEVVVYVGGDVPVCEYQHTGTDELGDEVAAHLADRGAALLANHGLVCVGRSAADALHTAARGRAHRPDRLGRRRPRRGRAAAGGRRGELQRRLRLRPQRDVGTRQV